MATILSTTGFRSTVARAADPSVFFGAAEPASRITGTAAALLNAAAEPAMLAKKKIILLGNVKHIVPAPEPTKMPKETVSLQYCSMSTRSSLNG